MQMPSKYLIILKKVWIVFNYKIFELTLYKLGLIQNFFPGHGVLVIKIEITNKCISF